MGSDKITTILSNNLNISSDSSEKLLNCFVKLIEEKAQLLEPVTIQGFGTFESKLREEREAVHPATGKKLLIPPKVVMTFRPSASLKSVIKKG